MGHCVLSRDVCEVLDARDVRDLQRSVAGNGGIALIALSMDAVGAVAPEPLA
jgi:hypothetical protein